jgi:hypothetical protein
MLLKSIYNDYSAGSALSKIRFMSWFSKFFLKKNQRLFCSTKKT